MVTETHRLFPIQRSTLLARERSCMPEPVYMKAYEVYCHLFGEQGAMVDLERGCRGGFEINEIVALLYAASFPREEWRARSDEALSGGRI